MPNEPGITEINRIKQETDRKYSDSQKEKQNLFLHYTRIHSDLILQRLNFQNLSIM